MPTDNPTRVIPLTQGFNMRDLGGLRTSDGRGTRRSRVFRSEDTYLFSEDDEAVLGRMELQSAVDLRTPEEVSDRGSVVWDRLGMVRHTRPLVAEMVLGPDRSKYLEPAVTAGFYLAMLEQGRAGHGALWHSVTEASAGKSVIHCASGRDRTGLVVALLLGFLGVEDEQIIDDYAMSGPGMERMLGWLEENRLDALADLIPNEMARRAFIVTPAETMELFLGGFRERYGSFEAYAQHLGIGELLPTLRERLLEG